MRTIVGAELFAFADAVAETVLLRHGLQTIREQHLLLQDSTSSFSLFSVVVKSTTTMEKRAMIYPRGA